MVESGVHLLADLEDCGVFLLVHKVRFHCQFDRTETNEQHDKAIEVLMLLDEMNIPAEAAVPME